MQRASIALSWSAWVALAGPLFGQNNLAARAAGGKLAWFSSQYSDSDWAAANLIDGSAQAGWSGQSNGAQTVIVAFRDQGLVMIEDLVVNPYSREGAENWVREIGVHASTSYPFRDFRPVGTMKLEPVGNDQVLSFDRPLEARYLKLVMLKNGGGSYMQAGEVKVIGRPVTGAPPAPSYQELNHGATIERYSSQYNDSDWAAANLLLPDGAGGQWAGTSGQSQEVVVALARNAPVTDIAIDNYAREGENNWARGVDVELSAESAFRGFAAAGSLTLPPVGDLHTLSLPAPKTARYVKLLFRTNGGGGYIEAARVRIYGAAPSQAGTATIARQLEATGRAVTQEIHFATNSAEILPESSRVLDEIAALLREQPALELIIEGHTDTVGGADTNLALSRRRADAVKFWLVDRAGIAEVRLTTAGYGATRPIASNDSDEGRARNRRVELVRRR